MYIASLIVCLYVSNRSLSFFWCLEHNLLRHVRHVFLFATLLDIRGLARRCRRRRLYSFYPGVKPAEFRISAVVDSRTSGEY
ncbi:hypothetical protein B0H12DRAFT_1140925 [Mycena haematopus]|nr:hypothetical protein B0H12DRAFT_1140925 [Mycena haematopus]